MDPPSSLLVEDSKKKTHPVPVGNLIDFGFDDERQNDVDEEEESECSTPKAPHLSPTAHSQSQPFPGSDSGDRFRSISLDSRYSYKSDNLANGYRYSNDDLGAMEQNFEGVGNGFHSGATTSLMDSPLDDLNGHLSPNNPSANSSNNMRRIASAATVGSQLIGNGTGVVSQSRHSRRGSFSSDVTDHMSVSDVELHSEITEISSTVTSINKKLVELEEAHFSSDEKTSRVKADNAVLRERLNMVEEQLQQTEDRWKSRYEEEKSRHKDLMARAEREKTLELESWMLRYQVLEKENQQCSTERDALKGEKERLNEQIYKLNDQIEDFKFRTEQSEADIATVKREYSRIKVESDAEMATSSDLVEELSRQNDELRRVQTRPRQASMAERTFELEEEVRSLREERRHLLEQQAELNAQLLQASVDAGRSLLAANAGTTLADEMHGKDKNEPNSDSEGSSQLLDALKEQEMCNQKLRMYIEGILMRVIEKHPEILEINK